MFLSLLWLVAFAAALYIYFRRMYSFFLRNGIKNEPPVPLLGNMAGVVFQREHISDHLQHLYQTYKTERFVGRYEFVQPTVLILDLELVKKIAVKDFEHFLDHQSLVDQTVDPLFGRNVFNMKGEEWKEMRSALSPAFTSSKMRLMVPFMVEVGNQMIRAVKKKIQDNGGFADLDVLDLTTRQANDVIASCAFGTKVDSHNDVDNYFYGIGKQTAKLGYREMMIMFGYRSVPAILKFFNVSLLRECTKKFFRGLILSSMRKREEENIVRNDLIHLLMEARKGKLTHENKDSEKDSGFAAVEESTLGKTPTHRDWSDDDLVSQAVGFFFAGFDTVSSSMSWLLHELAVNPDIQERLAQEIKENNDRTGGKFDYNSIQEMKYLDMVISESLRKWPPAVWLDRLCTKDYNLGKPNEDADRDFIVRKGQTVNIPAWCFHRDPQYFPDPVKFDPERFSDENKHKINTFTYLPFGLGPRNCIGSRFALCEMKVLAYMLIQHLELSPCEKTCLPERLLNSGFTFKLQGGHWLRFKIRK